MQAESAPTSMKAILVAPWIGVWSVLHDDGARSPPSGSALEFIS